VIRRQLGDSDAPRRLQSTAARLALGLEYAWFGALKVCGASPATKLVVTLLARTLPFCPAHGFLVALGAAEVALGLSFWVPAFTRVSVACVVLHLCATALPLALLPDMTWAAPFVPTLEGQYILKNAVLFALALGLLRPEELAALRLAAIDAVLRMARSIRHPALEPGEPDEVPPREVVG
jgi:hypothetical protein